MKRIQGRPSIAISGVIAALVLAILACSGTPASTLNEGKGTRNDPVPVGKYMVTTNYEVRAQAVSHVDTEEPSSETDEYRKVQFLIKCRKSPDDVCDLDQIRENLKLVSVTGIIFDPVPNVDLPPSDKPLGGDILGEAEKAGWLVYEIPIGLDITLGMAEYETDRRGFFVLP
ncbi:hypothetical protein [Aggregatilinea lenta]|uniref:hypothetical protein n=1 Tax=Aggregatilinea lenta TaxID=913108 RepID=UPI000E5B7872|nr:hypothetical protein [Aggregatilinea lenta]